MTELAPSRDVPAGEADKSHVDFQCRDRADGAPRDPVRIRGPAPAGSTNRLPFLAAAAAVLPNLSPAPDQNSRGRSGEEDREYGRRPHRPSRRPSRRRRREKKDEKGRDETRSGEGASNRGTVRGSGRRPRVRERRRGVAGRNRRIGIVASASRRRPDGTKRRCRFAAPRGKDRGGSLGTSPVVVVVRRAPPPRGLRRGRPSSSAKAPRVVNPRAGER